MAPISHSETFSVSLGPEQVRERVLGWFASVRYTVVADTAERLELKSGSQAKLRFLGGAFIGEGSLPARTVVEMQAVDGKTQVTVTASDAVGFGAKTGIKGKYAAWLAEITAGLREALTAKTAGTS